MAASAAQKVVKYKLVDIGANLTSKRYSKDVQQVIERAKECGIVKMMLTGTSMQGSREALDMANADTDNFLYCTAGVHPHDAKTFNSLVDLPLLRALAAEPKCVAIGECGLDFNRNFSPQDVQLKVFEEQVCLAIELSMPLFLHERDAHSEMVDVLTKHLDKLPPTVIHCFTGKADEAKKYLDMGLYIGLTGFLWKDRLPEGVQFALKSGVLPVERLLLETDAPFMYPNVNQKNKLPPEIKAKLTEHSQTYLKGHCSFDRNEPCALPTVADLVAAFIGVGVVGDEMD